MHLALHFQILLTNTRSVSRVHDLWRNAAARAVFFVIVGRVGRVPWSIHLVTHLRTITGVQLLAFSPRSIISYTIFLTIFFFYEPDGGRLFDVLIFTNWLTNIWPLIVYFN